MLTCLSLIRPGDWRRRSGPRRRRRRRKKGSEDGGRWDWRSERRRAWGVGRELLLGSFRGRRRWRGWCRSTAPAMRRRPMPRGSQASWPPRSASRTISTSSGSGSPSPLIFAVAEKEKETQPKVNSQIYNQPNNKRSIQFTTQWRPTVSPSFLVLRN